MDIHSWLFRTVRIGSRRARETSGIIAVVITVMACCSLSHSAVFAQAAVRGKFALIIGINQYDHAKLVPLQYAVNDAADVARLLTGAGYEVVVLTDKTGKVTKDRVPTL